MKVCDFLRFSFYRHLESSRRLKASQGQEVCARFNLKSLMRANWHDISQCDVPVMVIHMFVYLSFLPSTHSSTVWIHVGAQMSLPDWTCTHTYIHIYTVYLYIYIYTVDISGLKSFRRKQPVHRAIWLQVMPWVVQK